MSGWLKLRTVSKYTGTCSRVDSFIVKVATGSAVCTSPPRCLPGVERGAVMSLQFTDEEFQGAWRELDEPQLEGGWELFTETMGVKIYRLYDKVQTITTTADLQPERGLLTDWLNKSVCVAMRFRCGACSVGIFTDLLFFSIKHETVILNLIN